MKNLTIFLGLLLFNIICFFPYFWGLNYAIVADVDPNPVLILNPFKEIILHLWKWTELWNLGGNTDWQTGRLIIASLYFFTKQLVGIKSRFLFEVVFLTFAGYGMYLFSKDYLNMRKASILSAIIYMYNPYVAIFLERNLILLLPYATFPYFAKLNIDIMKSNTLNIKHFLLMCVLFNLATINLNPGTFLIMFISLLIVTLSCEWITVNSFKRLFFFYSLGLLLSCWNIIPIVFHQIVYSSKISQFLLLERFHSLRASIINNLTLTSLFEYKKTSLDNTAFFSFKDIYKEQFLLFLPAVAIISIFFHRNKKLLGLYLLFVLGIFFGFSDAPMSPFQDIFIWLETHTMYAIFRNNFKFSHMILIAYSLLVPYSLLAIKKTFRFFIVSLLIAFLVAPYFMGKIHKKTFYFLPKDIDICSHIVNSSNGEILQRVLLLPGQHLQYYKFHKIYMNRPILFAFVDKPLIFQDTAIYPYDMFARDNIQFFYEKFLRFDLAKIFSLFRVRFVIIDKTLDLRYKYNLNPVELRKRQDFNLIEDFLSYYGIKKIYSSRNYSIFEAENINNIFKIVEPVYTSEFSFFPKYINSVPNEKLSFVNAFQAIFNVSPSIFFLESKVVLPFLDHNKMEKNITFQFLSDVQYNSWNIVSSNNRPYIISKYEYGYGALFTNIKNAIVKKVFDVDLGDHYFVFVKVFLNSMGGALELKIDNKKKIFATKSELNKFVWCNLGSWNLTRGLHTISIKNISGFNAIDRIVIFPKNKYYVEEKRIESLLKNKTVVYLFEAESDLYRGNVNVPDIIFKSGFGSGGPKIVRDLNLTNREGLEFYPNSKVWQNIEILKEGYYRLGLKFEGNLQVQIGKFSFDINSPTMDTKYTPPIYLEKGNYYLQITPGITSRRDKPLLDVIYLFSVPDDKANVTLEDLFKVEKQPAQIKNFKKINPTLWKVKVSAQKPFMLSFAEAYDPLWEARVYKDGKKVKTVRSIPLYSVINGFWIDETGDLEIVLRYKPQDWFERGLVVSILTFLACVGYLLYDWRKKF